MRPASAFAAREVKPPSTFLSYLWEGLKGIFDLRWLLSMPPKIVDQDPPKDATVTIIIPCKNEKGHLTKTVESLRYQTHLPYSVIIAENGPSDDGTIEEADELARRYPGRPGELRVFALHVGKTESKAEALNAGLNSGLEITADQVVQWKKDGIPIGEKFMVMDSDTEFEPNVIKLLLRHFYDKTVAAVCGYVINKTPQSGWHSIWSMAKLVEYLLSQGIFKNVLNAIGVQTVASGCIAMYDTELVMRAGGFRNRTWAEDMDLTLALQVMGYKVVYEPLARCKASEPETLKIFWKQRRRWQYGSLQCFRLYFKTLFWMNFRLFCVMLITTFMSLLGAIVTGYDMYVMITDPTSEIIWRNMNGFLMVTGMLCFFAYRVGGMRLVFTALVSIPAALLGTYIILLSFVVSIFFPVKKWDSGHGTFKESDPDQKPPVDTHSLKQAA